MTRHNLSVEISTTEKTARQLAGTNIIAHTAWALIQPKIALPARRLRDQTRSLFVISDSPLGIHLYISQLSHNHFYLSQNLSFFRLVESNSKLLPRSSWATQSQRLGSSATFTSPRQDIRMIQTLLQIIRGGVKFGFKGPP